jgi:hypothetical protein
MQKPKPLAWSGVKIGVKADAIVWKTDALHDRRVVISGVASPRRAPRVALARLEQLQSNSPALTDCIE